MKKQTLKDKIKSLMGRKSKKVQMEEARKKKIRKNFLLKFHPANRNLPVGLRKERGLR